MGLKKVLIGYGHQVDRGAVPDITEHVLKRKRQLSFT